MKRSVYITGIFVIFSALFLAVPALPLHSQQKGAELPFKDGETLTYVLSYTWGGVNTDVGEGVATLKYKDGIYNAVVKGKTYRFYDLFFKVREHFESDFDGETMRPLRFYRNSQEGKYRMINDYKFDNSTYRIYATTKRKEEAPKDSILPGKSYTYDLVTLYYMSRNIDFSFVPVDQEQPISFAIDREIHDLYFVYKGKEVKKMKGVGTFNTMKFAVRLVAGEVFTGEDEMFIWVSDDKNKIPLWFESKILVGTVYGRLKKWENLKYPLESKIK
ncbi:MAG: DUF3108 domain-containing protein [Bacteroidales bacterium]|nr:DUF3108 domain-containing protein [Bacteroidales bacterium]